MSHYLHYYFPLLTLLHGFLMRVVIEPSPLGEHRLQCSMTPTTNNTIENKTILHMVIYKLARCSIYNGTTYWKENQHDKIATWKPYRLLEIYNTSHGGIYIHIHIYIYQNFFSSTDKQWSIHILHLINHLPSSFIRPKVLPLPFNLLNYSIRDHEDLSLQNALRFCL